MACHPTFAIRAQALVYNLLSLGLSTQYDLLGFGVFHQHLLLGFGFGNHRLGFRRCPPIPNISFLV